MQRPDKWLERACADHHATSPFDPERTARKVWVKSGALHFCETNSRGEVHLESADYEALVAALGFHGWRRVGSDCTGRAMCPRARRHGRIRAHARSYVDVL